MNNCKQKIYFLDSTLFSILQFNSIFLVELILEVISPSSNFVEIGIGLVALGMAYFSQKRIIASFQCKTNWHQKKQKKENNMKTAIILTLLLSTACGSNNNNDDDITIYTPRVEASISLTNTDYYPDSIAAMKDGTLFVGSMGSGQIDKIAKDTNEASSFIPEDKDGLTALGLLVDEDNNKLWACHWDFKNYGAVHQARLRSFNLITGQLESTHLMPKGSLCNDLTQDQKGHIYITCSFTNQIYRLNKGASEVAVWSNDALFSENKTEGAWTINGISWDGTDTLFVTRTDTDSLLKIKIKEDGSADKAEKIQIEDEKSNMGYDGIKVIDANNILIAEYATGRISKITINKTTGVKSIVKSDLNWPTNIAIIPDSDNIWVAESQINHLLGYDTSAPDVPFQLSRSPLNNK